MSGTNIEGRKRFLSRDVNTPFEARKKLEVVSSTANSALCGVAQELGSSSSALSSTSPFPSSPSTSYTPWKLPSSSQCVKCKSIACSCGILRPNPEVTRRRLEKLRLNTPYEKAKAMRYTEALQVAERKQRQQIESLWKQAREVLLQHYASLNSTHALSESEQYRRDVLQENEAYELDVLRMRLDGERLFLQVFELECKSRSAVRALEERTRIAIVKEKELRSVAQRLFQREFRTRTEALMLEESERAILYSQMANEEATMETNLLLAHRFYAEMHSERDLLFQKWAEERNQMLTQWKVFLEIQQRYEQERSTLAKVFLQRMNELQMDEEMSWRRLQEKFEQGVIEISQKETALKQMQDHLCCEERECRHAVWTSIHHQWTALVSLMERERVSLQRAQEERERRWLLETRAVLLSKELVVKEEAEAFVQLFQLEQVEKELCLRQYQESLRLQRSQLEQASASARDEIEQHEEESRRILRERIADDYELQIQRMSVKRKEMEAFFLSESAEREDISKLEYQKFFSLYTLKAEGEIVVHRLIEKRRNESRSVLMEEERSRHSFSMVEEYEREYISIAFAHATEEVSAISRQHQQLITKMENSEISLRSAILRDEKELRKDLRMLLAESSLGALKLQAYRLCCALEGEETRQRQYRIQEEIMARGQLTSFLEIATRSRHQENMLRVLALLQEVEQEEHVARSTLLVQHEEEWGKIITEQQCQYALTDLHLGSKVADDAGASLREGLVKETLKLNAPLSYPLVNYAAEVIDFFHSLRHVVESRKNRTARAAEGVARQLETLESQINEKLEQKNRYVEKLSRDREDASRIESALKEDLKRYQKEIQLENQKLQMTEKQLRHDNQALLGEQEAVRAFLKGSQ